MLATRACDEKNAIWPFVNAIKKSKKVRSSRPLPPKSACTGIFCYSSPDDSSVMADAVQAQQRNLYQTKFAHLEYRDGLGNSYNEQLRQQSWPVVDDVPPQAQPSASAQVSSSSSGGGSTGSSRW